MKTLTLLSIILTLSLTGYSQSFKSGSSTNALDSVVMGPGYANDIYYSFEDGVVATVDRNNWDIGIQTTIWSATIITNGGGGVELYTYPNGDTTSWASVDTNGMYSGWPVLYDSEEYWEDGAFNRNATGHPDYGWGRYNTATHNVVGDSIYILKTMDGDYKKIWIQYKQSSANTYFIRQANLDGSDDHVTEMAINPYTNMNFVYYDFTDDDFVNREPDTDTWDILFTKYIAIQPNGDPYPVVGVLSNLEVYANEFYPVGPDFIDFMSMPFDSTKSAVGWEWKSFDMGTFTWTVADSTAFFVQSLQDNIYKLVFTKFEGSTTGNIVFNKEYISAAGIFENTPLIEAAVYPNPATDQLTIDLGKDIKGEVKLNIFDMSGKLVYEASQFVSGHKLAVTLPASCKHNGLHLVNIITGEGVFSSKFMIYNN